VNGASGIEITLEAPRPVPLRRNKGFRMLRIGQLLSDTGTETGMLAYPMEPPAAAAG
jgi:hypothetical protein